MQGRVRGFIAALLFMCGASSAQANSSVPAAAAETLPAPVDAASPPPPTIADLVLLLKSYAPYLAKVARLRAELEKPIPESGEPADLARAWHAKAQAAEDLADPVSWLAALRQALAYAEKAGASPRQELGNRQFILQDLAWALHAAEGFGAGIDAAEKFVAEFRARSPGAVINPLAILSTYYVDVGNIERAKSVIADAENLVIRVGRNAAAANYIALWSAWIELARGDVLLAQGQHDEAERAFVAARSSMPVRGLCWRLTGRWKPSRRGNW